jgi:hypothetical protein
MELPKCDLCGKVVKIEEGILSISFREIRDIQEQRAKWEKNHPGPVFTTGEVMTFPRRVHWIWSHMGCNTNGSYDIEATRIDDLRKALHWTIHLQSKNWFQDTDWRKVIHRLYPECD